MPRSRERKTPIENRPWLRREFKDGKIFTLEISYILKHIDSKQLERIGPNADSWTRSKEYLIDELLDSGMIPDKINPIQIVLHPFREELSITDGITRLRVYSRRGFTLVRAKMFHG